MLIAFSPESVNRLVPTSGLSWPPVVPLAASAVNGRSSFASSTNSDVPLAGNGHVALGFLFCSFGERGLPLIELYDSERLTAMRSDLERSSGVSRLAGDSASDFLTLRSSGFLRRRIDIKDPRRECCGREALMLVVYVGDIAPRPDPERLIAGESITGAVPFCLVLVTLVAATTGLFSSSLSGRSLESPSSRPDGRGIPRTG